MRFNDLLRMAGYDPNDVAIMLHNPAQPDQRRMLMVLVDDAPDLFEAYQDNHPRNPEATLKKRKVAASFVVGEGAESRFVGLYAVKGWTFRTASEMDADPIRQDLMTRFRDSPYSALAAQSGTTGREVFDLQPLPALADLRGRLIVPRPPGRAYMRLAENCDLPILAVERLARFSPPLPHWRELVLTKPEIVNLPSDWHLGMAQWRGVYLITDMVDGARYVGSAYGAENIIGRWRNHVAGDYGVTKQLRSRLTAGFQFSILELLLHDQTADDVIRREHSWIDRLHTRTFGLNQ